MGWTAPAPRRCDYRAVEVGREEPEYGTDHDCWPGHRESVFQVHTIDADGEIVVRQQLKRAQLLRFFGELPPALLGIEACATAHYWACELQRLGHDVRLLPPTCVKPYVRHEKNPEERCRRCRIDRRGCDPADHAVRAGQDGRAAIGGDAAPAPRPPGQTADDAAACRPRSLGRVRDLRRRRNCPSDTSRRRAGAGRANRATRYRPFYPRDAGPACPRSRSVWPVGITKTMCRTKATATTVP